MRWGVEHVRWLVIAAAFALPACASGDRSPGPVTTTTAATSSAPAVTLTDSTTSVAALPSATRNWFDLAVGDCITALPAVELGDVAVTLVDCARPHGAEVYLRAPLAVNTAITDVAGRQCSDGLADVLAAGPYQVAYLIDSTQDRTTNNPLPSTVICLVQRSDGQPLTGSARR